MKRILNILFFVVSFGGFFIVFAFPELAGSIYFPLSIVAIAIILFALRSYYNKKQKQ
jgi:hypothetical protein